MPELEVSIDQAAQILQLAAAQGYESVACPIVPTTAAYYSNDIDGVYKLLGYQEPLVIYPSTKETCKVLMSQKFFNSAERCGVLNSTTTREQYLA